MTNCGASSESCCTSLEVTGGTFYRTYTTGGMGGTAPATVSGFRLDKYEVTVGRFRQFVAAYDAGTWTNVVTAGSGKHVHLNGGQGLADSANAGSYESGWNASDDSNVSPTDSNLGTTGYATWTHSASTQENLPINDVNWWEAYAFCIWDGGFLPSEAEWEYAAAGGSQQRVYPWGSAHPGACPGTSCYAIYQCLYPNGSGTCTGVTNIADVGTPTQGVGGYGQLDLAGSVDEWDLDWEATFVDPCVDCTYLTAATNRAARGGNYEYTESFLQAFWASGSTPTSRLATGGFRCARTP
jgi:formylglycine-generating enzyme